jgi:hypothetical protein
MKRRSILIALAAAVVVAAAGAGGASASTGRDTDRFEFRGVTAIVVDNRQGRVRVIADGGRAVAVERKTTSLFTTVTQSAVVRDGVLYLTSRCSHVLCLVDFRIEAPKGVDVRVTNRYADVTVTGSPGDVRVRTTKEGDITLDLAPRTRTVAAWTRDGDVTINGRVKGTS